MLSQRFTTCRSAARRAQAALQTLGGRGSSGLPPDHSQHGGSDAGDRAAAAASPGTGPTQAAASAASPPPPPLVHRQLQRIIRADLAAEEAVAALFRGQQTVLGRRPDLSSFQEREELHAVELRRLAPAHRVRPSLLAPALRAGFWALGAAAALAPRPLGAAVTAGLQDALTDTCNEQLRALREQGLADAAPQVRQAVRAIRDEPREVHGAPAVPDVLALQRLNELSPPEAVAAVVKLGARAAIGLAGRL